MECQRDLLDPALMERISGLSLVARRVVEGVLHGLHRSPLHGLSIEFAQHREYSPGDELKRLDWQVLARSDRYVIKQYEQETNLRAVIFLDSSASMGYGARVEEEKRGGEGESGGPEDQPEAQAREPTEPEAPARDSAASGSKFAYARVMAAALSYLMLHQADSVGLMLTTDSIREQVPPRAAPGHVLSICRTLERTAPAGRTDLASAMLQLGTRLKRRSLVILISDLLDDPERVLGALGQLHHRGHEIIVFQVLDPRELDFDLGLGAHGITVIRDMETGAEFDAEPHLIREFVRGEVRRFLARLDAGARGYSIHLLRCTTRDPLEQVLTAYLHRRLRLKK